jgi:hypothetical protein
MYALWKKRIGFIFDPLPFFGWLNGCLVGHSVFAGSLRCYFLKIPVKIGQSVKSTFVRNLGYCIRIGLSLVIRNTIKFTGCYRKKTT